MAKVKTKKTKRISKTKKKPIKKIRKVIRSTKKTKKIKKSPKKRVVLKKRTVKRAVKTKKAALKKKSLLVKRVGVSLKRVSHNPIIIPTGYPWESKATFNPAAFEADGKIYLIYRAIGDDDNSVLGYAKSDNGFTVSDRSTHFIYKRQGDFVQSGEKIINYSSGGGWGGGCEDPRVTRIGDTVYMIYTAFDGWGSLRLALTSIKLNDFQNKKWNWKKPVLISPPGEIHKNWVLFPEKINGKYAILHSFYPKILIAYFDSLDELDGKTFIKSDNSRPVDKTRTWDSWFRGVGPSPIKTGLGWLILYHAMDHRNPDRYRMGAVILDLQDPTKVLYRSETPILEPEEHYENSGYKWGVIYSCGAVVKDGTLFVYYGGADRVVCVATIPLFNLLQDLKEHKKALLKNAKPVELK